MNNGVDLSGTNSDGNDCEDLTTQQHSTLNSGNMPSSRARSGVLGDQTISRTAAHFLFPLETPLRLSRSMLHGWKENSMLAKPLAACTYLSSIVSELYDA